MITYHSKRVGIFELFEMYIIKFLITNKNIKKAQLIFRPYSSGKHSKMSHNRFLTDNFLLL